MKRIVEKLVFAALVAAAAFGNPNSLLAEEPGYVPGTESATGEIVPLADGSEPAGYEAGMLGKKHIITPILPVVKKDVVGPLGLLQSLRFV